MFQLRTDEEHEQHAQAGVRHLFRLGPFAFADVIDDEGEFHHYVVEESPADGGARHYEADRHTMYELLARYLAGEYEKSEYRLERSPGHQAMLDLLEIVCARARGGETDVSIEELDAGVHEDMDDAEEGEAEGPEAERDG